MPATDIAARPGRILPLAILVAFLVAATNRVARAEDLIPLLPRDTLAALSISDLNGLEQEWESTPLGRAQTDPRLAPFIDPIAERGRKRLEAAYEYWGVTPRDVERFFPGGIAIFNTHFDWPSLEVYEFDLCFLAEIGKNRDEVRALVERLLERTPVDAQRSRFTFRDETVYTIRYTQRLPAPPPQLDPRTGTTVLETPAPGSPLALVEEIPILIQYALVDGYLLVAEGRNEPIREMIAALKDPAERLEQVPGYRSAASATAGSDRPTMAAWFDAGRAWDIYARHKQAVAQNDESKAPDLQGLGLKDLGGLLVRMRLDKKHISADAALNLPKAPRGVVGLLIHTGSDNSLQSASLCPPDALSYSSILYDGTRFWSGLRFLLLQFVPQAWGFLNLQVDQLNRQFGIDIERGIVGSLGGEFVVYRREAPSLRGRRGPFGNLGSMTFLIGLRDGQTFRQNHRRLFEGLTAEPYQFPIRSTTYLDHEIWTFKQDPEVRLPTIPAWSLTDDYLIVSTDSEEIPGILRAWSGKSDKSLAQVAAFQRALAEFPLAHRVGFDFTPVESLSDQIQLLLSLVPLGFSPDWPRPDAARGAGMKEALARYLGPFVSASYVSPETLSVHLHLLAVE